MTASGLRLHAAPVLMSLAALLAACGKKDATPPTPAPVATPVASAPAAPPPASAASAPVPAASAVPVASTDPDSPTPLTARELKGQGLKSRISYYYAFKSATGAIKLTATAKNLPSGSTNALTVGLYDTKANRLCYDTAGNTTSDKTFTVNCTIDKAQPLVLRLDLSEETIDYTVAMDGPVELASASAAAASAPAPAGVGSTDIDEPTRLSTNRIKSAGKGQGASYYYAFNAGPGELTLTIDGKNSATATAEALRVGLYTQRSERICQTQLGNTTLDKRAVESCMVDKRQPVILRVDVSEFTLDWRVRFEGPYDFEPFTPPKQITIALDAAVLFDTGKATIKPEARTTLHEAAERIKKFADVPVVVSGHTDNVGSEASNQKLSEQRAQAVKDYLSSQEGVPAARLSAKGFGKSQPVADNGSDAGRARNRRVDVTINARS
ncbi:OmpA family protein [Piscinibacter terrae]|uniref:OmpA family protein n=1 Tax=Piscinibacter terrae TaxID=2496871 RepID=A0A3N7K4F8_9BURK|nr:OmpA family protein [Albitalea terrae]RQP25795.1 OmpA family protein [Albitalea terrae]